MQRFDVLNVTTYTDKAGKKQKKLLSGAGWLSQEKTKRVAP